MFTTITGIMVILKSCQMLKLRTLTCNNIFCESNYQRTYKAIYEAIEVGVNKYSKNRDGIARGGLESELRLCLLACVI
jgi:hypothetical protein